MIKAVSVVTENGYGTTMQLNANPNNSFVITNITGLDPVTANINVSQFASFDGGVFNSARSDARNITMDITYNGLDIEALRMMMYLCFPVKGAVRLYIETDYKNVYIDGIVESNTQIIFSKNCGCTISIICPDPYFYGASGPIPTVFNGIDSKFEFPFSNESVESNLIEFGDIVNIGTKNVKNLGTITVGMTATIDILGDFGDITIVNETTRQKITINRAKISKLVPAGFLPGDRIVITTKKQHKTVKLVRTNSEINLLNAMDYGSDWIYLVPGDNVVTFLTSSGQYNTKFKVEYEIRYGGI